MWVPLATAVVWGLAFSSILTLVVTPCLLALPAHLGRAKAMKPHKPSILTRIGGRILGRRPVVEGIEPVASPAPAQRAEAAE